MTDLARVGVAGCGVMGAGIAELCARNGVDVIVLLRTPMSVDAGRRRLTTSVDRAVRKGKLTESARDALLARVSFTTDVHALADRNLVIESIREHADSKRELFALLDKVLENPDAVLASNTSSIPIMTLARVTNRPEQVVGIHFFNPVPVMPLVELVETLVSGERTARRAERFLTGTLGKQVVRCRDRSGFLVNGLLVPYLLGAIRMVESGFAAPADIDRAMTLGCAHPMGPLALVDLIGLDTIADIAAALHGEFKEAQYAVPPLLSRMVDAGMLGRKTGRGFHFYA